MEKDFWTPQEVADLLRFRVQTVYEFIRLGRLEALRFGRRYRIGKAALERFLEENKTRGPETRTVARLKLD